MTLESKIHIGILINKELIVRKILLIAFYFCVFPAILCVRTFPAENDSKSTSESSTNHPKITISEGTTRFTKPIAQTAPWTVWRC